jgi:RimJ/RimL family protein N-acetyltransferase
LLLFVHKKKCFLPSMNLGPEVDPWPRPLPARTPISGTHVTLEPMHRRHTDELFEAMGGAEASFAYMGYGPFANKAELAKFVAASAALHDPMFWVARPVATGLASGWLTLMEIEPAHAAIELGNIWFSPRMQRTRAATEAMFLLLRRAAEELGYRRLVWKCNALNEASIRAAHRLGFTAEGVLRAHKVVKGRERDTAMYSMTAAEWPDRRDAILAWLAPENFAPDGTARRGLASFRS